MFMVVDMHVVCEEKQENISRYGGTWDLGMMFVMPLDELTISIDAIICSILLTLVFQLQTWETSLSQPSTVPVSVNYLRLKEQR